MFQQISLTDRSDTTTIGSCKAFCHFSPAACNVFVPDKANRQCYIGNTDSHNQIAVASTDALHMWESKGERYVHPDRTRMSRPCS